MLFWNHYTSIYNTTIPYPTNPIRAGQLGTMRDLRIGGVESDGAQYVPSMQSLQIYTSLDLKISFGGNNTGIFGDNRTTSIWNLPYQKIYSNSLLNYPVASAHLNLKVYPLCGEDLLIITSPALRPAADMLASARSKHGFRTKVVEVGSGPSQIGTTSAQIQNFIKSEFSSTCLIRPSYVTIVGDTANVPTFLVPVPIWGTIASDLPYALLTNPSSLFADVAIGRIPAGDLATANLVVNKVIGYEDSPPTTADFYSHATFASYFQDWDSKPSTTTDQRGFTKNSETIRDALKAGGYNVDRIYYDSNADDPQFYYDGTPIPAELRKPGFAWNGNTADVINDWNAGRFIIFHRDHGSPDGWLNLASNSFIFSVSDIPSLTNGNLLPVVFSINCASGKFDDPGTPHFAEQLLQKNGGGAVGVIGDSRNSPSFTNNHIVLGFFDAIFPDVIPTYGSSTPIRRMGDVLNSGKLYMDTQNGLDFQTADDTEAEHYLYHWFGDPTMEIYTSKPGSISGMKFNDLNGNGINDAEPGVDGWTITLTGPSGSKSTVTSNGGKYKFEGLTAGTYIVEEVLQPGWKQTAPTGGTYIVTILSGDDVKDKDFGNEEFSIYGMKFNDLDSNGIKDSGESGLSGWHIRLVGIDTLTYTPVNREEITDANGNYGFVNVNPGIYQVFEMFDASKAGWVPTTPVTVPIVSKKTIKGINVNFGNKKIP